MADVSFLIRESLPSDKALQTIYDTNGVSFSALSCYIDGYGYPEDKRYGKGNCTSYVFGRCYEVLYNIYGNNGGPFTSADGINHVDDLSKNFTVDQNCSHVFADDNPLTPRGRLKYNAKDWTEFAPNKQTIIEYSTYFDIDHEDYYKWCTVETTFHPYPVTGCIMVSDNGDKGHVMFVEDVQVTDNGEYKLSISQSSFGNVWGFAFNYKSKDEPNATTYNIFSHKLSNVYGFADSLNITSIIYLPGLKGNGVGVQGTQRPETTGHIYIRDKTVDKKCSIYICKNGLWKRAIPNIYTQGSWKTTI